jgi:hypothetical protein
LDNEFRQDAATPDDLETDAAENRSDTVELGRYLGDLHPAGNTCGRAPLLKVGFLELGDQTAGPQGKLPTSIAHRFARKMECEALTLDAVVPDVSVETCREADHQVE